MIALALAAVAAIAFCGSSLLALFGSRLTEQGRTYTIATAAGILLVLAFGDLFPESLEMAGNTALAGFVGGFTLLFVIETFTAAHTHHVPEEHVQQHRLMPFMLGLAIHNLSDGFALGASAMVSSGTAGLVGLGVLVHQVPVGISVAAVFAAARMPRSQVVRITILLGLIIPLAAGLTLAIQSQSDYLRGMLTGAAGGVLTYVATAHLLPEAQGEHPSHTTPLIFVATVLLMMAAIIMVPGG